MTARPARRRFPLALALLAAGLGALLWLPAAANAATGSISITGTSTVTRGLKGSFRISGEAPAPDREGGFSTNEVEVRVVPAAEPCRDTGVQNAVDSNLGFGAQVHGPASFEYTWEPPVNNYIEVGEYTLCAAVYSEFELAALAQMTMTVVKPEFHLRETVPHRLRVGHRARFSVYGSLQAAADLEVQIVPSRILVCGAASCHHKKIHECGSTREAEEKLLEESDSVSYPFPGNDTVERSLGAGPFHFSRRLLAKSPGLYRMCSWLTEQGENHDPARLFVSASWRVTK